MTEIIEYRPILREGRAYTVAVVPDYNASISDADYSAENIEAFRGGRWRFVGLVVTRDDGMEASLWGIHYGTTDAWQEAYGIDYLISEDCYVSSLIREIGGSF